MPQGPAKAGLFLWYLPGTTDPVALPPFLLTAPRDGDRRRCGKP